MDISKIAMENHKKLFPEIGVENTLDDELMEILLNFNFDEVQEQDHLDEKTRQMVILACTIASQTPKRYEVFVKAALKESQSKLLSMLVDKKLLTEEEVSSLTVNGSEVVTDE